MKTKKPKVREWVCRACDFRKCAILMDAMLYPVYCPLNRMNTTNWKLKKEKV